VQAQHAPGPTAEPERLEHIPFEPRVVGVDEHRADVPVRIADEGYECGGLGQPRNPTFLADQPPSSAFAEAGLGGDLADAGAAVPLGRGDPDQLTSA
jgi:hypothetical protein